MNWTISRMAGAAGGEWIILLNDSTEQKLLEEEMLRLNRLVSLGEISATVAHELRNPLTVMYLNTQLLSGTVAGEQKEVVTLILDNMERMEAIIHRMGLLSRAVPLDRKRIDLRDLVVQSLVFMDKTFREHGIVVEPSLPEGPLPIEGDPAQLQQALLNILLNAVQVLQEGGVLRVELGTEEDGRVRLAVADNGPGIPPELLGSIFDPFFTTKEMGTGLGLPITSRIIHSHGGSLGVASRPGEGARFTILLPPSRDA